MELDAQWEFVNYGSREELFDNIGVVFDGSLLKGGLKGFPINVSVLNPTVTMNMLRTALCRSDSDAVY